MDHLCDTCIFTNENCSCDVEYDEIENVIIKCELYSKKIGDPVFTSMSDKWGSFKRTYPNYPKTITHENIDEITDHTIEISNNFENKLG